MRIIDVNTFVNSFKVKPNNIMSFLLGAGASVSSGIMSGGQMVWDFKRSLYCTENNLRTNNYADLSKKYLQKEIQTYFDSIGEYPSFGSIEEYSFYFEKCYPLRRDREYYIQDKVRDVKPSLGYLCLGELMLSGKVNLVSTTNFDDLVAAGIHTINPGISVKTLSSILGSSVGFVVNDGFPNILKLHGDYLFDKLKNTDKELQNLEKEIVELWGRTLVDTGLIVLGYAGNDNSVMTVLEKMLENKGIKQGVYWCQPKGVDLSNRAKKFMETACVANEQTAVVEIDNFDDLMYKLFMTMNLRNSKIDDLWKKDEKKQAIVYENIGKHFETAVTNALPALKYPRKCYVFQSTISSWKELNETLNDACVAILYRNQVWALGDKEEIKNAFSNKIVSDIEEMEIPEYLMKLDDSDVIGMFYKIIGKNLIKNGFVSYGKDRFYDSKRKHIKNKYCIYEAVRIALSVADNNMFMNLLPTVHILNLDGTELDRYEYQKIVNQEVSSHYNKNVNVKVDEWINSISSNGRMIFELGNTTLEFNNARITYSGVGMINKCYQAKEPEMLFDYNGKSSAVNQLKGLIHFGPIEHYPNKSIRLAVLSPKEYARDIWEHLNKMKAHFSTTLKQDAFFLPEYIGFQDVFRCGLDIPNGNDTERFKGYHIGKALEVEPKRFFEVICQYINLFERNLTCFDVLVIYIPNQLAKMRELKNEEEYFDLHDSLKIYCAGKGIVTQIVEEHSVHTSNDMAKIVWGLSTAIYTKAVGRLWKPKQTRLDTAYVGLSYVQSFKHDEKISIGCSQLFDSEGNGMKLYLRPLKDPKYIRRNPYMRSEDACRLMANLKQIYDDSVPLHKLNRIVIHKTTHFTKEEMDGISKGFAGVENIELLQIQEFTAWRAIRFQKENAAPFPIQRGTVIPLDKETFLLWTHGSVQHEELAGRNRNYYKGGRGIPAPLLIKRFMGKSTAEDLVNEILILTKMNYNSGDGLYKMMPVTLDFAKVLSRVAKQDLVVYDKPYDFRYFM